MQGEFWDWPEAPRHPPPPPLLEAKVASERVVFVNKKKPGHASAFLKGYAFGFFGWLAIRLLIVLSQVLGGAMALALFVLITWLI